jgi:hypothetical protein
MDYMIVDWDHVSAIIEKEQGRVECFGAKEPRVNLLENGDIELIWDSGSYIGSHTFTP